MPHIKKNVDSTALRRKNKIDPREAPECSLKRPASLRKSRTLITACLDHVWRPCSLEDIRKLISQGALAGSAKIISRTNREFVFSTNQFDRNTSLQSVATVRKSIRQ